MPANLELAQTVAIGAFNPYIITPLWLVKYAICDQNDVNVRMVPLGEGASFRFGSVEWQVDNQKLSVSSTDPKVDSGQMVSKVLSLLPHTPVHAIGHNFHFTASRADWGHRPTPKLAERALDDLEELEQTRWSGLSQYGNARLETTLVYDANLVAILFNFHRNMNLEEASAAPDPEGQIQQACESAMQFEKDFKRSLHLLRSLFEMEMSND